MKSELFNGQNCQKSFFFGEPFSPFCHFIEVFPIDYMIDWGKMPKNALSNLVVLIAKRCQKAVIFFLFLPNQKWTKKKENENKKAKRKKSKKYFGKLILTEIGNIKRKYYVMYYPFEWYNIL